MHSSPITHPDSAPHHHSAQSSQSPSKSPLRDANSETAENRFPSKCRPLTPGCLVEGRGVSHEQAQKHLRSSVLQSPGHFHAESVRVPLPSAALLGSEYGRIQMLLLQGAAIMEGCPRRTVEEAVASCLTQQNSGAALGEGGLSFFG